MKEHVKDLWVAALRSGEYKQTQTVMHDGVGYCCLGVLCRVLGKQFTKEHEHAVFYSCEGSHVLLPRSVQDEAGMKSDMGLLGITFTTSLADLNDKGATFDEIASVISKNWETL